MFQATPMAAANTDSVLSSWYCKQNCHQNTSNHTNNSGGHPDYSMLFSVALENWQQPLRVSGNTMSIARTRYALAFQIALFASKGLPCRLEQRGGHTGPALSILHGWSIATKLMPLNCQNNALLFNRDGKQLPHSLQISISV
jgi:hypothetical protein